MFRKTASPAWPIAAFPILPAIALSIPLLVAPTVLRTPHFCDNPNKAEKEKQDEAARMQRYMNGKARGFLPSWRRGGSQPVSVERARVSPVHARPTTGQATAPRCPERSVLDGKKLTQPKLVNRGFRHRARDESACDEVARRDLYRRRVLHLRCDTRLRSDGRDQSLRRNQAG